MVHEKKKSGDPDYDDKVPMRQQVGEVVKAGDGETVVITETTGPTKLDGSHANLDGPTAEDLDNRPAPGGQATEASEVQVATPIEEVAPEATKPAPAKKAAAKPASSSGDVANAKTAAKAEGK